MLSGPSAEHAAGEPTLDASDLESNSGDSTDSQQSTVDSQQSTVDSQQSTQDSQLSTQDSQQSTVDSQQSTKDSQLSTQESQQSTVDSQQSAQDSQQSVPAISSTEHYASELKAEPKLMPTGACTSSKQSPRCKPSWLRRLGKKVAGCFCVQIVPAVLP